MNRDKMGKCISEMREKYPWLANRDIREICFRVLRTRVSKLLDRVREGED